MSMGRRGARGVGGFECFQQAVRTRSTHETETKKDGPAKLPTRLLYMTT